MLAHVGAENAKTTEVRHVPFKNGSSTLSKVVCNYGYRFGDQHFQYFAKYCVSYVMKPMCVCFNHHTVWSLPSVCDVTPHQLWLERRIPSLRELTRPH